MAVVPTYWVLEDEVLTFIYCLIPGHDMGYGSLGHRLVVVKVLYELYLDQSDQVENVRFSSTDGLLAALSWLVADGHVEKFEIEHVCDWVFGCFYETNLEDSPQSRGPAVPRTFFLF